MIFQLWFKISNTREKYLRLLLFFPKQFNETEIKNFNLEKLKICKIYLSPNTFESSPFLSNILLPNLNTKDTREKMFALLILLFN